MPLLKTMCLGCNMSFEDPNDIHSTLCCGSLFHLPCINDWRRRGSSCPQCLHYNPITQKLYLSFDDFDNMENKKEMNSKLKTCNDQLSQLECEVSVSELQFLALQMQLTDAEESKKEMELDLKEIEETEKNFLSLQAQYTECCKGLSGLEECLKEILIQNDLKKNELHLKRLEHESVKARLETNQGDLIDGTLQENVKLLEEKLEILTLKHEEEVARNTQLAIDKMRLESQMDNLNLRN